MTEQMTIAMLDFARLSFDTSMRNLEIYQDQAERAVELALSGSQSMREETRRATKSWLNQVKKAGESYTAAVEAGLRMLERQMPLAKAPEKSKQSVA